MYNNSPSKESVRVAKTGRVQNLVRRAARKPLRYGRDMVLLHLKVLVNFVLQAIAELTKSVEGAGRFVNFP